MLLSKNNKILQFMYYLFGVPVSPFQHNNKETTLYILRKSIISSLFFQIYYKSKTCKIVLCILFTNPLILVILILQYLPLFYNASVMLLDVRELYTIKYYSPV